MISTFAITLVPEFDAVIRNGAEALAPGGRFAILDFKRPHWAPFWVLKTFVAVTAPFGVTLDLADRHAWKSLECYLPGSRCTELYLGFSYLAVGRTALAEGSPVRSVAERT